MNFRSILPIILFLLLTNWVSGVAWSGVEEDFTVSVAETGNGGVGQGEITYFADDLLQDEDYGVIAVHDPLEAINRAFFSFNDKLYFWVLKPVAQVYGFVIPKPTRQCVGNFFYNLKTPVRLVNNLLQGEIAAGHTELVRFAVNSTIGIGGLWDPARNLFDISAREEDLGQTLGEYGVGEGFYICWPVLGPSNVRDSLGLAGDYFLNPVSYLGFNHESNEALAVKALETTNKTSLSIGDYEDFKKATFDPYSALRDAYFQQRRAKIGYGE